MCNCNNCLDTTQITLPNGPQGDPGTPGEDATFTPLEWIELPLTAGWVTSSFSPNQANNTPRYAISNGWLYLIGIIFNPAVGDAAEQIFVDAGLFAPSRLIRTSCHEWNEENHSEILIDLDGSIKYNPRTIVFPDSVVLLLDSIPPIYIGSF